MPTSGTTAFDLNIRDLIDEAYERMLKSDVKYRFVIDNATMSA